MTETAREQSGQLDLAEVLVRMTHLVQHVFTEASRDHDLTPQQVQLLCMLKGGDALGMTEISRQLHLEKSSLTGLVDRVERRELVIRTRDPRDRRGCRIQLTERGEQLAVETHEDITERLNTLTTAEFDVVDREQLHALLARFIAADNPTHTT